MKTFIKIMASLIVITIGFNACQKDSTLAKNESQNGTSVISIKMTDSPADYLAVNIDIKTVEILYMDTTMDCKDTADHHFKNDTVRSYCDCDDNSELKWVKLPTISGIYNLLNFQNGLDTLIATGTINAGHILQIRLILGDNNSLVIGTDTIQLKIPSGMERGLKLVLDKSVTANSSMDIVFDFDAATSIVVTGHNGFILKPVLRLKMAS